MWVEACRGWAGVGARVACAPNGGFAWGFVLCASRFSPRRICLTLLMLGNLSRAMSFLVEILTDDPLEGCVGSVPLWSGSGWGFRCVRCVCFSHLLPNSGSPSPMLSTPPPRRRIVSWRVYLAHATPDLFFLSVRATHGPPVLRLEGVEGRARGFA